MLEEKSNSRTVPNLLRILLEVRSNSHAHQYGRDISRSVCLTGWSHGWRRPVSQRERSMDAIAERQAEGHISSIPEGVLP